MEINELQYREKSRVGHSRRQFLRNASTLAAIAARLAPAGQSQAYPTRRPVLAYVGTYSSVKGPEGNKGNGEGIYLFEMDPGTGALSQRAVFPDKSNPSWLAFDPSKTHLYAANETETFEGSKSGSVSAFSIDRSNGHLSLLNMVSSGGSGPAYLSVHPSGKYVLVANYGGGTAAVLPIRSNGELSSATDIKQSRGALGSSRAKTAPVGSFAISGHDAPHVHMIEADPSGKFVLASDLGLDQIFIWKFESEAGKLAANQPASVPLPSGDGPRHFAFHPNGRWLYSLQEEASTLVSFDYDVASGSLIAKQTVSSLPRGFAGTNFTSEIMVSPDGKFVYAANRLHDSIAFFSVGDAGTLTFAGEVWTEGDYPRSFNFDPTGNFLYSCNQRSDAIAAFRVNRETGNLTFTGQYTAVGSPAIILFLG